MLARASITVLFLVFMLIASVGSCAVSPDTPLLQLVPPESAIVAGMHASESDLPGNFLMVSRSNRIDMDDFLALTGADTSRIIHEVVFVADGIYDPGSEHSLLVSGVFGRAAIFKYANGTRASTREYRGITVMVVPPLERERKYFRDLRWMAILDSNIAIFGTVPSVQRELDRYFDHSHTETALVERLKGLNKRDDTWSVVGAPLPGEHLQRIFGPLDPELGAALQGGGIFGIGIEFGNNRVTLHYELTPASVPAVVDNAVNSAQRKADGPPGMESAFLAHSNDARGGESIRGSLKVSRHRYEEWLTKMLGFHSARERTSVQ